MSQDDISQVAATAELDPYKKKCRYTPLSLVNLTPYDTENDDYEMREHLGDATEEWIDGNIEANDVEIEKDSLIGFGIHKRRPKLLICITMYNEPPKQLVESIAGIYRAYYELSKLLLFFAYIFVV